ncbi:carboxymuconolactone decarboxylase family protein [Niabella insulamsoli]|uniref:carboxymuconolactone decarboxylase family protein n=1 Tax=Niabella insulamsoli TaxID=3144874 RepID=UPI0031FDD899
MEKRINISETEPAAYKAMFGLENYLATTGLTKTHKDLIKIRASQINGCAFCIDMHTKEALKNGESNRRIFLLNAWRETDAFTKEEKIVLEMTEEITLIHKAGLSEATYAKAVASFDKKYIAQLIMMIVTINGWNRIAVSTEMGFGA